MTTKVPIVKFFDSLTRLQVDISLGPANGIQSAETVRGMMRTQPALRPLAIIVKHFLALQKLNEVFTGGMGGFAIVCMVMAFLQVNMEIDKETLSCIVNLEIIVTSIDCKLPNRSSSQPGTIVARFSSAVWRKFQL